MNVMRYLISGLVILIIIFTFACSENKGQTSGSGRPGGQGAKVPVEAIIIKPQMLKNLIYATGTLMANEEVVLRSELSGRVTGVFFDEGKKIRKGSLMLKINDRDLKAELKRKELQEQLAADEERRKRSLLEISGISQEEYDKSLNALKMIQAEKEVLESQLAKTEITAPFDGVVGLRYVSEGSYISPDMLAATMQDIDPMKVEFSIPEKYSDRLKTGTEISLIAGEEQEETRGRVYAVESKIDLGTRTIKARATISNPQGKLIPGSFVKVRITLEEIPDAIVIPSETVIPQIDGDKVFVCRDGVARLTSVHTGIRTDSGIQIIEGLVPQDTLIRTGLLQLADGRPVVISTLVGEKE